MSFEQIFGLIGIIGIVASGITFFYGYWVLVTIKHYLRPHWNQKFYLVLDNSEKTLLSPIPTYNRHTSEGVLLFEGEWRLESQEDVIGILFTDTHLIPCINIWRSHKRHHREPHPIPYALLKNYPDNHILLKFKPPFTSNNCEEYISIRIDDQFSHYQLEIRWSSP